MGRSAHVPIWGDADHLFRVNDRGFHYIGEDLAESWVEDWAAVGIRELEALLANHAAFRGYLDTVEE